jgi:hypothetical protein
MGHKRHPPVRLTEEIFLILQNSYPDGCNSREAQLRFRLRHWPNLSQELANIPDSTASTSDFVPTESPHSETPLSQADCQDSIPSTPSSHELFGLCARSDTEPDEVSPSASSSTLSSTS